MLENRLGRRNPLIQTVMDNWFYLLLVVLVWQLPYLLGDYFDQPIDPPRPQGNQPVFWMGVAIQLYILVILAMSYNLVFGFAGILSFGHALYFGIGVYTLVIIMDEYGYSMETATGVAISLAILAGLLTSLAVFRIKRVYFAMFTLASAQIFHDLVRVNLFKFLTEGDDGRTLGSLPDWINPVANRATFYYICGFLMVATFFFIRRLMNSPTGKVVLAIRDNEERAQTMGYNTALYKALMIVLAGALAGLAGVLHAIFTRQAEPTSSSLVRTTDPLFMTIIGGTGTHPGPIVGAIILHLGEIFLRKPDLQVDLNFVFFHIRGEVNTVEVWRLLLGVVFILIVLAIPFGVVGQINLIWLDIRRWIRKFIYNPLVRSNPNLALMMSGFTGEPPALAQAVAEQTADASLLAWVQTYPFAAAASAFGLVGLLLAIGDLQTGISVWLLGALILLPLYLLLWIAQNYSRILGQLQDMLNQFR